MMRTDDVSVSRRENCEPKWILRVQRGQKMVVREKTMRDERNYSVCFLLCDT